MNTDTQVDPSATTEIQADDQLQALEDKPETNDADDKPVDGDAQIERDKTIRKLQRRIDSRTRGLGERDARIAALEAELARHRESTRTEPTDEEPATRRTLTEEDVDQRAEAKLREREEATFVSSRTKEMIAAGKSIPDFSDLAAEVAEDLPFIDRQGRATPFIKALLDIDSADMRADVMTYLGKNPEVRDELIGLSERQLARKLTLIETSIAKKPEQRSRAAKPIEPLGGNARGDPDPSDTRSWIAARNRQLSKTG